VTEHPEGRRRFEQEEEEDSFRGRLDARALPGGGKAVTVIVLLGVCIFVDAAALVVDALQYRLIEGAVHGKQPPQALAALYDSLEWMVGLVQIVLLIATAVAFCIWTFRAYKNLKRLRVGGLQHSPGWAVGYFFIPIVQWYKPSVVFVEMWKASDPKAPIDDPAAWQTSSSGALIGPWWICWIVSNLISSWSARLSFSTVNPSLKELQTQVTFVALSDALSILAGLFAILVVKGIQDRQSRKYHLVLAGESSYFADRFRKGISCSALEP
jgi:hypothetical protein